MSPNFIEADDQYEDHVDEQDTYVHLDASTNILSGIESVQRTVSNTLLFSQPEPQTRPNQPEISHLIEHQHLPNCDSRTNELSVPQQQGNIFTDHGTHVIKNDEFGKFGDYIAEVLRGLPRIRSRSVQMKIMEVLCQCEENL